MSADALTCRYKIDLQQSRRLAEDKGKQYSSQSLIIGFCISSIHHEPQNHKIVTKSHEKCRLCQCCFFFDLTSLASTLLSQTSAFFCSSHPPCAISAPNTPSSHGSFSLMATRSYCYYSPPPPMLLSRLTFQSFENMFAMFYRS